MKVKNFFLHDSTMHRVPNIFVRRRKDIALFKLIKMKSSFFLYKNNFFNKKFLLHCINLIFVSEIDVRDADSRVHLNCCSILGCEGTRDEAEVLPAPPE